MITSVKILVSKNILWKILLQPPAELTHVSFIMSQQLELKRRTWVRNV